MWIIFNLDNSHMQIGENNLQSDFSMPILGFT